MTIKRVLGVLVRVALSVIFAGIFYIGWMAIALPTYKSGFGGLVVKAVIWILAPILTGLGFAVGSKIFELLPATDKNPLLGDLQVVFGWLCDRRWHCMGVWADADCLRDVCNWDNECCVT